MLFFFKYKGNNGLSCDILKNVLFTEKAIPKWEITEPVFLFMATSVSTQNLIEAQQKAACVQMYWSHINGTGFNGINCYFLFPALHFLAEHGLLLKLQVFAVSLLSNLDSAEEIKCGVFYCCSKQWPFKAMFYF